MMKKTQEQQPPQNFIQPAPADSSRTPTESGHPACLYSQVLALQRTIGNRACQNFFKTGIVPGNAIQVIQQSPPGRIARVNEEDPWAEEEALKENDKPAEIPVVTQPVFETPEPGPAPEGETAPSKTRDDNSQTGPGLKANMATQVNPAKPTGDIDQDTGNCSMGAKLILLKIKGFLKQEIKLTDVLEAFYQGENGQKRVTQLIKGKPCVFVYGKLSYKKLEPVDFRNARKANQLIEQTRLNFTGTIGWWAFGGDTHEYDDQSGRHYREVYRGVMADAEISPHLDGYMVFSDSVIEKKSFEFSPLYQDADINIQVMRGEHKEGKKLVMDTQDLKTFVKTLKKHFPHQTRIQDPAGFSWQNVSKPAKDQAYLVARPGHFFVMIVREILPGTLKGHIFDPVGTEVTEGEIPFPGFALYTILGQ